MTRSALVAPALLLALVSVTAAVAPHRPALPRPRTPIGSALALAQLDQGDLALARPGVCDLYDLTRRLTLRRTTPIDPYIRPTAPDYQVGRTDTFYIAKATSGYTTTRLTLLFKTPHAYWYVPPTRACPRTA